MAQINIGGANASVQLQGNNTITSDQTFTFPDTGGELVVTPGTADIETTGSITAELAVFSPPSPQGVQSPRFIVQGDNNKLEIGCVANSGNAFLNIQRASDNVSVYYWTGNDTKFRLSITSGHIGTDNGTIVGTQTSDSRLKKNIRSCDHGLAEVLQLEPKFFEYINDPETAQAGFIAQEVQLIIPEAVYDTKETLIPPELVDPDDESQGYKPNPSASEPTVLAMDYVKLIPALVNAIKELQSEIQTLKGGAS